MVEGSTKKTPAKKPRSFFDLLFWLALFPVVLGSLLCFGQLALLATTKSLSADTRSLLSADYKTWLYQIIPSIDLPKILADIQQEEIALGTPVPGVVATGPYWVPPTATTIYTPTLITPATPTITSTGSISTAVPSTTTQVLSQTPTRTVTPVQTSTTAPTYTNTAVPPTATSTNANPPAPTPTRTRTPTPPPAPTATQSAPTYSPVIPIAENSGSSSPVAGGCQASFGYQNNNAQPVDIQIGMRNALSDEGAVVSPGQPTHFQVGQVSSAFSVTWTSGGPLIWSLDGRSAVANWCNP